MITTSAFVHRHNSFWKTHFPALENYVRVINSGAYERVFTEQQWNVAPDRSYLVSEVAFCLAEKPKICRETVEEAFSDARARLLGLPGTPEEISFLTYQEMNDTVELSRRTSNIIKSLDEKYEEIVFNPYFCGCGILFGSYGDILAGTTLVEIKSVDRGFRATDFRQLLTYFFQNNQKKRYQIDRLAVVNPRRGITFSENVGQFVFDSSGSDILESQNRFLSAIGAEGLSR